MKVEAEKSRLSRGNLPGRRLPPLDILPRYGPFLGSVVVMSWIEQGGIPRETESALWRMSWWPI